MSNPLIDEKNSIAKSIEALGLPYRDRSRALATLAKADALVEAFFAARKLLKRGSKQAVARPSLKSQ